MRTSFLLFLLIFLASCNGTKTASTTKASINSEAPYFWMDKSFPKTLRVSTAFSASEVTNLEAMGTAWKTAVEDKATFFAYGTREAEITNTISSSGAFRDGVLGVYRATKWPYPDYSDALAVTQIFAYRYNVGSSSEYVAIDEADIIMNYEWFDFDNPDPYAYSYDFRTVMLHEMGHFLGLLHKPKTYPRADSVMYPSIFSTEIKRVPQSIDAADLANKYSITLGTGSASAITSGEAPVYEPQDAGVPVQIILELKKSGECVHRMDGVEIQRHHVKLN